jgi:S-adenosylmethionine:tRNA ribosyltransferase-isomerase
LKTADFDYDLPKGLIAQKPAQPRDAARMIVFHRNSGDIVHTHFRQLGQFLNRGDLLVINRTRVIPARLFAKKKQTGGRVELLLLRKESPLTWETLVKGKKIRPGLKLVLEDGVEAVIVDVLDGPRRRIKFTQPVEALLGKIGVIPLPPYIYTPLDDPEKYQTVYSEQDGSVAAPTAGLHFTRRLIDQLLEAGVKFASVTLHIGLDTFAPVFEVSPMDHQIHTEWCHVPLATATAVNQVRQAGGRIIAVGTTSVRALETAGIVSKMGAKIDEFRGSTDLFILPGYSFRVVDAIITNFHLPRSSLLMLISAFAGRQQILSVYETAKNYGYRFYSFGDVMFIQ